MKKSRKLAFVLTLALVFSCFGSITSFAFDTGYNSATEYTNTVTAYLSSYTQVDWYKFTLTQDDVSTYCDITLRVPDSCVYNFDVWYRSGDSGQPSIVTNETLVGQSRNRYKNLLLSQAGTYFVRVYSQNGTASAVNSYRLSISYRKNMTCEFMYATTLTTGGNSDWAGCADILGNHTYNTIIKNSETNRNYKNAYVFIKSNYTSDKASNYDGKLNATPEQTAIATDYVYSGSLMTEPKFEVISDKEYSIEELMYYLNVLNEPIIFYLQSEDYPGLSAYKRYVILKSVNIGLNRIEYYDPQYGVTQTVNYEDFLSTGIEGDDTNSVYTRISILNSNLPSPVQAIYD